MPIFMTPPENVEQLWPVAAPMLARAIEYTDGETSIPRVAHEVASLSKQLWFVVPRNGGPPIASGVTSLKKKDDGTIIAEIELFSGDNMDTWFDQKEVFEQWARDEGCKKIRIISRRGWAKPLKDYKITHYIMVKELT